MVKDHESVTEKQHEEDAELCFELQLEEAITASVPECTDLDHKSVDRSLAQKLVNDSKKDLHILLSDKRFVHGMQADSSNLQETFTLYSKGLVSEGYLRDDTRMFGGFGVSICDHSLLDMKKAVRNELLALLEVVELIAIIHVLEWALDLELSRVTLYCDKSNILEYKESEEVTPTIFYVHVTRKAKSEDSTVAKLVEEVTLLQSRFLSFRALFVRRDIIYVIKLAKDDITSQTRWIEDGIELETCPICFDYAQPCEMFEMPTWFHRVCIDCMKKQVTELLHGWKGTHCPCCKTEIQIEDCRCIADPGQIDVMIHRKIEEMIHVADRVYCPNPSCSFSNVTAFPPCLKNKTK
ncbi:unnamed protein product [Eruca vesicaria subsp. sativa]|uniref:RING-type domain-containing protein n=1 Tax=Eruca vesicaria subsp. sativa TaxID=29727 RepID=A0ABC8KQB3_ERUVS|nr:unnamed protein product [Eruca vesicaria subsp. sativa]